MAAEVFISYSHTEDAKWMASFRTLLEREITRRLGRKVTCWRDPQILPGHDWEKEMLSKAAEAKVFVAVLSPGWLNSDACRKESQAFQGRARIGARSLKVAAPPEIGVFQYADFFKEDESGVVRTFPARNTGHFKKGIEDLAMGIVSLLDTKSDQSIKPLRERVAPRIMERCGVMRILDMTQPIDSAAIYTQVNVLERLTGHRRLSLDELRAEFRIEEFGRFGLAAAKEKRVDGFAAVERYLRLLILGKPGAGKTTFLKRLAVQCAKGEFRPDLVPAFVELRGLADRPILDHIHELWGTDPWPVIEAGRAMVLLDGLDEVPDDRFASLRTEIEGIAERAGASPVLMTCRIASRDYVFQQFSEVEVADFGEEQIAEFSRLWFTARRMPEKAEAFQSKLAANKSIQELAQSPLLLTMMCLLFEGQQDFDGDRAELYREAVEVLLRKWDSSKSIPRDKPYQVLTLARKQDLLGSIARSRFEKGEYLFEKRSLEQEIAAYFSRFPQTEDIDAEKIVRSIEAQHGLLVERARKIHSFAHLTFQEYFTAKRIVDGSGDRWSVLIPHMHDTRWREVFLLVVSMVEPDELLIRMRMAIDESLRSRPPVQEFLGWLARKSTAVERSDIRTARSAFYWTIGQVEPARRLGRNVMYRGHRKRVLAFLPTGALGLAFVRLRRRNLDLDYDLDNEHEVDLNLAQFLARDHNFFFTDELDPDLGCSLEDLNRRAEFDLVDETWFNDLSQTLVEHRDIGHPFPLTVEDLDDLDRAYLGYETLVACMNASRVTAATRKYLEDTIMMPWEEIQKIPLPPGLNL
ncbi:MAG: TIR domain-containing protein [Bryobacteraceae bacterium]|nr:TIR domain-containing protein [Bryobacteraceae bacterium]